MEEFGGGSPSGRQPERVVTTCSQMLGLFFDTMTAATTVKEWLK